MTFGTSVEHRGTYSVVQLAGTPTLKELLAHIDGLEWETLEWDPPRVLLDLRGIATITGFSEQFIVGRELARRLSHLERLASLVFPERITNVSAKAAATEGLQLRVFSDEDEAVRWLTR